MNKLKIKLDITYGSVELRQLPAYDEYGCFQIGSTEIIRRDEKGNITEKNIVGPYGKIVYEDVPIKKSLSWIEKLVV